MKMRLIKYDRSASHSTADFDGIDSSGDCECDDNINGSRNDITIVVVMVLIHGVVEYFNMLKCDNLEYL
jgi:hypothetical protein